MEKFFLDTNTKYNYFWIGMYVLGNFFKDFNFHFSPEYSLVGLEF